jgi:acetate kinase
MKFAMYLFSTSEKLIIEGAVELIGLSGGWLWPKDSMHRPSEIKGIDAAAAHYPGLKQVICFDNAFHCHMPEVARRVPILQSLWHEGIHRYGFHGLSEIISKKNSTCTVRVIPTNEDLMIARHTRALFQKATKEEKHEH